MEEDIKEKMRKGKREGTNVTSVPREGGGHVGSLGTRRTVAVGPGTELGLRMKMPQKHVHIPPILWALHELLFNCFNLTNRTPFSSPPISLSLCPSKQ